MDKADVRKAILESIALDTVTACIIADGNGIAAGTAAAEREAGALGLADIHIIPEGSRVMQGDEIARFRGRPGQIAVAEERLIGLMAKPSGIASAARQFVDLAGERPGIIAGAWKKMPPSMKEEIRQAVVTGGASCRISSQPFLYLDKNYIRMLGGISKGLAAVAALDGYLRVVQVRGEWKEIGLEAREALERGADIIFIDSGRQRDLESVINKLKRLGLRDGVKVAFGGNVRLEDVGTLKALDADFLDVGRSIIDAPLLDMHLDVTGTGGGQVGQAGHE